VSQRSLHAVLHSLADTDDTASDAELLRQFLRGDEQAFAELVRRHGRLVWSVCRHLSRSEPDAEDAFQATFLVLLKNAKTVRATGTLSAWLYGVAYKVCANARRGEHRRTAREHVRSTPETSGAAVPESAWDRALAAVHEEVAKLPEVLRVPFVLCCLEGKGVTEAAQQLGWKLGTLSSRLTRAKDAIVARLDARGLTLGAIAALGVTAPPPTVAVAKATAVAQVGFAVPASVLQLSHGVISMSLKSVKALTAIVVLSCGLGLSLGTRWSPDARAQPTPNESVTAVNQSSEEQPPPNESPTTNDPAGAVKRLEVELELVKDQLDRDLKQLTQMGVLNPNQQWDLLMLQSDLRQLEATLAQTAKEAKRTEKLKEQSPLAASENPGKAPKPEMDQAAGFRDALEQAQADLALIEAHFKLLRVELAGVVVKAQALKHTVASLKRKIFALNAQRGEKKGKDKGQPDPETLRADRELDVALSQAKEDLKRVEARHVQTQAEFVAIDNKAKQLTKELERPRGRLTLWQEEKKGKDQKNSQPDPGTTKAGSDLKVALVLAHAERVRIESRLDRLQVELREFGVGALQVANEIDRVVGAREPPYFDQTPSDNDVAYTLGDTTVWYFVLPDGRVYPGEVRGGRYVVWHRAEPLLLSECRAAGGPAHLRRFIEVRNIDYQTEPPPKGLKRITTPKDK